MGAIKHISPIVGILHLTSRTSSTTNKIGVIRKEFTPFLNYLPKMLVKTKKSTISNDVCAIIEVEGYENGYYLGYVSVYIGDIGSSETDKKMVEACATCHWHNKLNKSFGNLNNIDITPNREIICGDIYTIDPEGCNDIDDALCIKKDNDRIIVDIHIADVTSYIEYESVYDKELANRCSTIYIDNTIHMIPEQLSVYYMSLKEQLPKRAFTVRIIFDEQCNIIEQHYIKTLITVKQNLSYENAQEMIKTDDSIKLLYEMGNTIKKKMFIKSFDCDELYDTHQMVAIYMMLANHMVAKYISSYDPTRVLLRVHDTAPQYNHQEQQQTPYTRMHNMINLEKAYYRFGLGEHKGLSLDVYTHFTSPIRRYADIIVHRQLMGVIEKKQLTHYDASICDKINTYEKVYQVCERYNTMLNVISNKQLDNNTEVDAYVINLNKNSNNITITVYIPLLKLRHDVLIVHHKLMETVNVYHDDDLTIYYNDTETTRTIKLYDKIKLTISICHNSIKKINVSVKN